MNFLVKMLLLPVVMLSAVSCSTMQHSIRKNNSFTDKTIALLFQKTENVFYLKSTYATFSVVWIYDKDKIEIYRLAKGKVYERTEYPNNGIADFQIPTFKELDLDIKKCPFVLDGDGFGYRIKRGSEIEQQELPIDIECLIKNKYQSEFLNKIVADIITYKMWNIHYQ